MVSLIATQPCEYDGKRYAVGEAFHVYAEHAQVLVLLGKARHSDAHISEPSLDGGEIQSVSDERPVRPKRVYRRRTVTPEDTQA